jgi:hypothetical protein
MVMSVCFDDLKLFRQFLYPALGDRSHHQSLKSLINLSFHDFGSVEIENPFNTFIFTGLIFTIITKNKTRAQNIQKIDFTVQSGSETFVKGC